MKNEIQIMPLNEIVTMAQTFAESGMFTDAKSMAQAFVKIQAGQEIGIPPFASMGGIHIIQGKPTIGAGLIASTVKGSGKYDYKIQKLDDTICSIDFYQGTSFIGNSQFTIADAKKALTKNIDKFPKNMLFARAISNGVKFFCPDVFAGPVYTPEEMNVETTQDIQHIEVIEPENVKVKILTDSAFKKLLAFNVSEIDVLKRNLTAIDEGFLNATSEQTLLLTERFDELELTLNKQ